MPRINIDRIKSARLQNKVLNGEPDHNPEIVLVRTGNHTENMVHSLKHLLRVEPKYDRCRQAFVIHATRRQIGIISNFAGVTGIWPV